jgi:hypothetical protein
MALERIGKAVGFLLAPLTGAVAAIRHARMFHPEGVVYRARVSPPAETPFSALASKLESDDALVRLSTAWWRGGKEWMDVLGIALRIDSQDLLFATIQHPWTMPFAPLTTEQHDFLANDYFAVSPFDVAGVGRSKLRLVASRPRGLRGDRGERLAQAVRRGEAGLRLELSVGGGGWTPVAEIALVEKLDLDQEALRFSPFRDGKGLSPIGFVHLLRKGAYAFSQAARPARSREA